MTAPRLALHHSALDLTAPPALGEVAEHWRRLEPNAGVIDNVRAATGDERPRERSRQLGELFRKLDPPAAIECLNAAARLAMDSDPAGLRLLLGFLEVKRPGSEVLTQLRPLSSLRRVGLKLARGTWQEPEESQDVHPADPILQVLEEGAEVGALDLRPVGFPYDGIALLSLHRHLGGWFDRTAHEIEERGEIAPADLLFLTHLAMLEVNLVEKRVSLIASSIDPYDMQRIARLLPVLSRYDQDIEHMKDVVSRIQTYEPFFERSLTIEQAITSTEMDKLLKAMSRDVVARNLGRIIEAMRARPVLDRELAGLAAQIHRIAVLRAHAVAEAPVLDPLSLLLVVLEFRQGDGTVTVALEPEVAAQIWPSVAPWGAAQPAPGLLEVCFREENALELLLPDGTPRLPLQVEEEAGRSLTLLDLVRRQIGNQAFILGLLDNVRACSAPGVVALLARDCRNLRVLDKIIQVRRLHTGDACRDVPRVLLSNPAPISIASLRRFIHVRFVSKTDLRRLGRRSHEVRAEVTAEVQKYLASLG